MVVLQLTATYSNAVLMMVLSNATDVSTKLSLPIITPIEPAHVRHFACDPRKGSIGGWLTLTNNYQFWYGNGYVESMEGPRPYSTWGDTNYTPPAFGNLRISEKEVIKEARRAVQKLGYDLPWINSTKPEVQPAESFVRSRVKWERTEADGFKTSVDLEINTNNRNVERFSLIGTSFWKKPPDIQQPDVEVPFETLLFGTNSPPPPAELAGDIPFHEKPLMDRQTILAQKIVCEKATEISRRLGLAVKTPILPEGVSCSILFLNDDLKGNLIIERNDGSAFVFDYSHGRISSIAIPYDDNKPRRKIPYSKGRILKFATEQVRKLGYRDKDVFLDQKPLVSGGADKGDPYFKRYTIRWQPPGAGNFPNAQRTVAIVEGATLQLTSITIRSDVLDLPSPLKPEKEQSAAPTESKKKE